MLFQLLERKLCSSDVVRLVQSIDDFLKTANSILQRRKSRAGRSLEHHVETLLRNARVPYEMRVSVEGTVPDVLIPSAKLYLDRQWPDEKLFVVGVKRTCKDRWRQVLREAPRIPRKHILTIQAGISDTQLTEMSAASVDLIVPKGIHKEYPKSRRAELLSVDQFVDKVKAALAQ